MESSSKLHARRSIIVLTVDTRWEFFDAIWNRTPASIEALNGGPYFVRPRSARDFCAK